MITSVHSARICVLMCLALTIAMMLGWMMAASTGLPPLACYAACIILGGTGGCLYILRGIRAEMERAYVVLATAVAQVSGLTTSGITLEQFTARVNNEVRRQLVGTRFNFIAVSGSSLARQSFDRGRKTASITSAITGRE